MRGPDRPIASAIRRTIIACASRAVWVVVAAIAVAVGAGFYAANNFAINTDASKLISSNVPWRQREIAFAKAFPQRSDLIAIVVDGATPELAEAASAKLAERLGTLHDTLQEVWRPDGGPFFAQEGLLFEPTDEVAKTMERLIGAQPLLGTLAADPTLRGLADALALIAQGALRGATGAEPSGGSGDASGAPAASGARAMPTATRETPGDDEATSPLSALVKPLDALAGALSAIAAGHPTRFSWQSLFTGAPPDPRALRRFVLVRPVLDYTALMPGADATNAIRNAVHALGLDATPGVRVRLTGPVPLADEEFATLADGAALNMSVTLVVVILLLWLAVHSWRLIVAILVSLAIGLVLTGAFGLAVFGAYNLISVAFAVLFVGLGVDFGIQFAVAYRARRHATGNLMHAIRDVAGEVGSALALAAAATAAGFYAFVPTEFRGVSELGVIAGTGMIIAFVASITVLPALVVLLRPRGERGEVGFASFAPIDRLLLRHRDLVLGIGAALAIASLVLLRDLSFDFNPLHLRSPQSESVATLLDLMKDTATSPDTIDVLAPSLDDAKHLAARLEKLPEVDHVLSLATFVPEDQEAKLAAIQDAAMLLGPTLEPQQTRPPPTDAQVVEALLQASMRLDEAAKAAGGAPFAMPAARVGGALRTLAHAPEAARVRARDTLMPGLAITLDRLRSAMQAERVTLASLPQSLRRDWVTADGRARVEVYPKGDMGDNVALHRFVTAVEAVAPDATGAPVSIDASSRTIIGSFLQAGLFAFVSITLILAFTLRRTRDVIVTLLPLLLSALCTLATCVVVGLPLNFENIIALPLLFGIGVAFNIYFVMAWRAGRMHPLQSSLTRAVIMSGLTTGTAFGSLWLSAHPGTASMGELLAISLGWTLVTALLFLPALLGRPQRK
jgi:hopanoid biosynthesis associated RND transporter like protein HpnN